MTALRRLIATPILSNPFGVNWNSPQANGLIHWWPLAGDLNDRVRHITAARTGNADIGVTLGNVGAVFPGSTGDYLNLGTLSDAKGLSRFTVAIWAHTSTLEGGAYSLRYIYACEGYNSGWMLRLHTTEDLIRWYVYSGGYRYAEAAATMEVNRWYHFAGVYNVDESGASQVKLYVDGDLAGSGTSDGGACASNSENVGIGSSPSGADRVWAGGARDARFYNRALSADEIYQLWAPQSRYDLYRRPLSLAGVGAPVAGETTIRLTWTANSEGETGFSIERSDDGGAFAVVGTVGAGIETYDDDADLGHTYTYRVRALSTAKGNSEYSNTATITV